MTELQTILEQVGNQSAERQRGCLSMRSERLLVSEIERLRAVLESLTKDPPATLAREPDEDWEVIVKMRAIARDALNIHKQSETT